MPSISMRPLWTETLLIQMRSGVCVASSSSMWTGPERASFRPWITSSFCSISHLVFLNSSTCLSCGSKRSISFCVATVISRVEETSWRTFQWMAPDRNTEPISAPTSTRAS